MANDSMDAMTEPHSVFDVPADSKIKHADSIKYWNSIPPDVNSMLGGYPQISRIDLRGSQSFLTKLRRLHTKSNNDKLRLGVDCGAGIGRVTEGFLSKVCRVVDIVEPVQKFASELEYGRLRSEGTVGDVFVTGLESWEPSKSYDLIWNQWCLGHLTDAQLVAYLSRCGSRLTMSPGGTHEGFVVVKENLSNTATAEDVFDPEDSSITRSDVSFRRIFQQAGLRIVRTELQTGFPKDLYPVRMYALRPS